MPHREIIWKCSSTWTVNQKWWSEFELVFGLRAGVHKDIMMKSQLPLQNQHIRLFNAPHLQHSARRACDHSSPFLRGRCVCSNCCYCHFQTPSKCTRKLADVSMQVENRHCRQLLDTSAGRSISTKDFNIQIMYRSLKLHDLGLKISTWWVAGVMAETLGICAVRAVKAEAQAEFAWSCKCWVSWSWWRQDMTHGYRNLV